MKLYTSRVFFIPYYEEELSIVASPHCTLVVKVHTYTSGSYVAGVWSVRSGPHVSPIAVFVLREAGLEQP